MEYLFLKRKKTTAVSGRQKTLLFKAAERQWEKISSEKGVEGRRVDGDIYKNLLYELEIKQVFLDATLSLKKLSEMLETNQTYVSNVVNRYFGCNLKELLNTYRVEYAKELLCAGSCGVEAIPDRCGFASKSAFYVAFGKIVGVSPLRYLSQARKQSRNKDREPDKLLIINQNMYNQF